MYSDMALELSVVTEAGLTEITFIFLGSGLPLSDLSHGHLELLQVLQLLDCSPLHQREVGEGGVGAGEGQGGHQASHGDTERGDHWRPQWLPGLQLRSHSGSDCERGLLFWSEAWLGGAW